MPSVARTPALDRPIYSKAEIVEFRRNILRYARKFPPGSERNQHRQIARSLRALFKDKNWLDANTFEGSGTDRCQTQTSDVAEINDNSHKKPRFSRSKLGR